MRQGWVYVMVNASMRNMVKVGRTTRQPHLRVAELSAATGVPTPFTLEFDQFYADCARAEREIHGVLDERGLRVSANREFFHGPADDIVGIIVGHAARQTPLELRPLHSDVVAGRSALEDRFCYADIARLYAARGKTRECLRTWDLFFAACETAGAGRAGGSLRHDPLISEACRSYVSCCLMLGAGPGHLPFLLQHADDMLEQQLLELKRSRGTVAAPRIAAIMRWIYDNLPPGAPGCDFQPGAGAAALRRAGQDHGAAA